MKRLSLLLAASLLILSLMSGCDGAVKADTTTDAPGSTGVSEVDADILADLIYANVTFEDIMTKVPSSSAASLYGLAAGYQGACAIYVSTGATPEEIAVFAVDDVCSADDLVAAANARIAKQTEGYASYAPGQVPKLDGAVVYAGSGYVAVCVSADNTAAAKLIKDYI